MNDIPQQTLSVYKNELLDEWLSILNYWMMYVVDNDHGGFYGSVNNMNVPDAAAEKGIVMNSRILWTFAASYLENQDKAYLQIADRAFNYINDHFVDQEYGGVYWSVDSVGNVLDGKKQVYGLAFCIYGMSEYYKASGNEAALTLCKNLFECIERYSFDKDHGGYLEAFTREWKLTDDLRLSEKDDNEKKTMNTHLHLVEAYANLCQVWPYDLLKEKIIGLLDNFSSYFINKESFHLNLFMDEQWNLRSSLVSFGHDIEASWLLLQCAEIIQNDHYIRIFTDYAIEIAYAATEGLGKDGGLWYEYEPLDDAMVKEKHSWPQAEAMIGFINVYQLTGNEKYLQHSLNCWAFTKKHIIDEERGEWFWGVDENNSVMLDKDKAGFWKCPYHSVRACREITKRIAILK